MPEDYHYLCFNCGFITPYAKWYFWHWDDEGNAEVEAEVGYMDPTCRCPVCLFDHRDDDSGPGFLDGKHASLMVERERAQEEWSDLWKEVEQEILG